MTTLAEKKAESAAEAETATGRVAPIIHESCVGRNRPGTFWCEWHVRFPEGGIADDLKESSIWRRVQKNPGTALKRFDEVRILAFDGTWCAHAVVAHATGNAVILGKPVITKLPAPQENLYQDDLYYLKFVGNGYAVFRKRDDQQMGPAVHSANAAQTALAELYPKRVG